MRTVVAASRPCANPIIGKQFSSLAEGTLVAGGPSNGTRQHSGSNLSAVGERKPRSSATADVQCSGSSHWLCYVQDKAIGRFMVRNMVDAGALNDLKAASAFERT